MELRGSISCSGSIHRLISVSILDKDSLRNEYCLIQFGIWLQVVGDVGSLVPGDAASSHAQNGQPGRDSVAVGPGLNQCY